MLPVRAQQLCRTFVRYGSDRPVKLTELLGAVEVNTLGVTLLDNRGPSPVWNCGCLVFRMERSKFSAWSEGDGRHPRDKRDQQPRFVGCFECQCGEERRL